jgi:glycosyltransferase involved in cell wall biosynthesis
MNKICFFNSVKSWGGGEKWHYDMSIRLHGMGFPVLVIAGKHSELSNRLYSSDVKAKVYRITNRSFLNPIKVIQLVRAFKKHAIDTVILNLPADLKVAGLAARLAGVKRIIYRRGSAIAIRNTLLNRFIFRYLVDDIITNSQETSRTVLLRNPNLFDPKKIHVIYNGIDLQNFPGAPGDATGTISDTSNRMGAFVIGHVGRFVRQKGQYLLLEAVSKLKGRGVSFQLRIAGAGKLEATLRQEVSGKGLDTEVVFTGFAHDIKAFMEDIDVFVLPSLWEGFGYVLVEAMACGKPVVAFNISSNPEIVVNGQTGFLVPPFDTDAMAGRLEQLASDLKLGKQLGLAGSQRVRQHFSLEKSTEALIRLITT